MNIVDPTRRVCRSLSNGERVPTSAGIRGSEDHAILNHIHNRCLDVGSVLLIEMFLQVTEQQLDDEIAVVVLNANANEMRGRMREGVASVL